MAAACVLLAPCVMFPGAVPGPRVVSLDDHLSVHHAFQERPGGRVQNPVLSDPAVQLKALHGRVVEAMARGHAPLWNPDIYCGAPLLADGQTMFGSPVTWLRLLLPEDQAQDAGIWWLLVWMGLGTLLVLRRLGADPPGALAGALLTMVGPFFAVWLHYPLAGAYVWIPWVVLAVEHVEQGGSVVWPAIPVAAMIAGGHPDPSAYGLILAMLWAIRSPRRGWVFLGLLLGICLAAPAWLPLAEQLSDSSTFLARGGQRLHPSQLLDLVWPGWHGHPASDGYHGPGAWEDGVLHPGLVAWLLLPWAVRDAKARWLVLLWIVSIVAAVSGLPGPLHHARLGQYGAWAMALAAGLAVRRLPSSLRWAVPAVALGTGLWVHHQDFTTLDASKHDPPPAAWTRILASRTGQARVIGLDWALQPNTGALAGLKDVRGYDLPVSRSWERFARAIDPRTHALWYPVEQITTRNKPLLTFAAVRFVLSPTSVDGLTPVELPVPTPLNILELTPTAPRAWLAWRVEPVPDAQAALDYLRQSPNGRAHPPVEPLGDRAVPPGLSPGREPQSEMTPEHFGAGETEAFVPLAIETPRPEVVRVRVTPSRPALLVLADTYAPGWKAFVDGHRRPIWRVGGYFRGVSVGPGDQTVVFRYTPWGWRWGLRLAALAGVALILGSASRHWIRRTAWGKRSLRPASASPPSSIRRGQ